MAFLQGENDTGLLATLLAFVDNNSGNSQSTSETNARPIASDASAVPTVSEMTPSFSIDCMETLSMMPLTNVKSKRIDAMLASFQHKVVGSERPLKSTSHKKANPNRARDDTQFELVYLREQVNELETKLRSMQLSSTVTQPALLSSPFSRTPQVWEEIAARQKRQCDVAQHENARLKVLVARKHKMASSLCEMLQKRLHQQNNECIRVTNVGASEQQSVQVSDFHGDIQDFQDLFQRLEVAYQEQETIFAANGLSGVHSQNSTNAVHIREINDTQVEAFASKVLPFSANDISEAVWEHFKGIEKHLDNGGLYGKSIKNLEHPFTILEDFTKELFSKNLRADVQSKQIIRRYVEPGRDMILFVSSNHPIEIKHKANDGLIFLIQEYVLTKCVPGCELTLVQLCNQVSIECKPGITIDARYIRSASRFWMNNFAGNIKCFLDRIENVLIDKTSRGSTSQSVL